MNSITNVSATEPDRFHCPENFFIVDPCAPALQDGVLGIHLQRIDCLIEAAKDELENNEKIMTLVLLETALTLLGQVSELVSHDEVTRALARKTQGDGVAGEPVEIKA